MNRPLLPGLALAAGLALTACSEPSQESSLQGPSTLGNVVAEPCTPSVFNSLINSYFTDNKQAVKDQKDFMLAELNETPADSVQARVHGFNVLRAIAARSKDTPAPSASTGSELAVEVLQCTFDLTDDDVIEQTPAVTAGLFITPLNRTTGGTFEVRGGSGDPAGAVQAAVNNVVIAGMGPVPPATWSAGLNGGRVLLYGDTASASSDYHISTVPGVTFNGVVATTCALDNDPSLMVTETGVGALAFSDASFIGCGGAPIAAAGRFDLLRHLAALGRELLLPEPAVATVALASIVGGSAKGRSVYDVKSVTALDVTVSPTNLGPLIVNVTTFSLTVTVSDDGTAVNGTALTLGLETNAGTTNSVKFKTSTGCDGTIPPKVSGVDFTTTITYSDLCITKTGGVKVVALANVQGRSAQGLAKTAKIKVIPN